MKKYPESLTMEDGTVINHRPICTIKCIYCGLTATCTEFEGGYMGILHMEPRCAEFTAMDPDVYLRENRKKFQQDISEGKFKPN